MKSTKIVKSSSRPKIMPTIITNFGPSASVANDVWGPINLPRPNPVLLRHAADPDRLVTKSSPIPDKARASKTKQKQYRVIKVKTENATASLIL